MAKDKGSKAAEFYLKYRRDEVAMTIRRAAAVYGIAPSTLTRALKRRKATTKPPKEQTK